MNLQQLQPTSLWKHFENLCTIPHTSKNEQGVGEYVKSVADSLGLEYKTDSAGNIVVLKPASATMDHLPIVTLQGHLDMVPQKESGSTHDFHKDPIKPYVDGQWVKARGTTLGADNGIGVACALALLEDKEIKHGPLEALFTVDEEDGMTGAQNIEPNFLSGDILINLDSERDGELCIGCAGGIDGRVTMELTTLSPKITGSSALNIVVTGLKGGHSGLDIDLGRGNAIKILGRLLYNADEAIGIEIADFEGGTVRNAIPREAHSTIVVEEQNREALKSYCAKFETQVRYELQNTDPGVEIVVKDCDSLPIEVFSKDLKERYIRVLYASPAGVYKDRGLEGDAVLTSGNLGVVEINDSTITMLFLLRSSIDSSRDDICATLKSVSDLAGAAIEFSGSYPGWQPQPESKIVRTMQKTYSSLFSKEARLAVVHAGLECGIIKSKYPSMEMVSCGPDIRNAHSPDESVNIVSVERFWNLLTKTLSSIE
ncbi:aminoacyl-histidine dipeptidase [Chitinispirillales bacterium ANBcel5]|uniref:aminoacyl-histidine dipeptidase n=1 Tax=Cellulosispirillum alkaliphilum TaxID=3039283 RepID=UPI002A546D5E|nr:aminoacyl-histidine dipeptidase [Chitinispirillales bacterium ANBcel5]